MEPMRRYVVVQGFDYNRLPDARMEISPELEAMLSRGAKYELTAVVLGERGGRIVFLNLMPTQVLPLRREEHANEDFLHVL